MIMIRLLRRIMIMLVEGKKLVGWGKWGRGRDRGAVPTWFTNTLLPPTLRLGEIFSGISYPPLFLVTDTFAKSMHLI